MTAFSAIFVLKENWFSVSLGQISELGRSCRLGSRPRCQPPSPPPPTNPGFRFSPCLVRKRVEMSEAILALLGTFQELHLEWYARVIIVLDFCFYI